MNLKIIKDIQEERNQQDNKWGANRHLDPHVWLTILTEEVGEVANEICESGFDSEILQENYRNELIQVAAVPIAMIEDFDANKDQES